MTPDRRSLTSMLLAPGVLVCAGLLASFASLAAVTAGGGPCSTSLPGFRPLLSVGLLVLGAVAGGGACLASGLRRGRPVLALLGFAIVGGLWLFAGVAVFAGIEVSSCIAD